MRAAVLREPGPAENLRLEDVDDPTPGPGEVVVRLRAAALNHRDVWIRSGPARTRGIQAGASSSARTAPARWPPSVAGADPALAGRAVVINPSLDWGDDGVAGPGVPHPRPARRRHLRAADPGAGRATCTPKPAALSFEEAAALPFAGLTAYRAVVSRAQVRAGETVLVTGIGGGVSTFALQIAARGAPACW